MVQRTMPVVCAWVRGICRCSGDGISGRSECCAFPYCDVRGAGLLVGAGATVPLGTAVGCAVWIRFGAAYDGVCVGTECQSVQRQRYFWAQRVLCISEL